MPSAYRDAATYDRISAPLERIGRQVLERLPRGHVIGLDGSPEMIAAARSRLGDRVELIVADLERLDLGAREVDAILSTATFHWIADHAGLFARLRAALGRGGRLVAQCGGRGNTRELVATTRAVGDRAPFAAELRGWAGPWNFAGPEQTAALLRDAGFTDVRTWLARRPAPYEDLREWLRTNALTAHLARLPEHLREPYVEAVAAELGERPSIAYIRLNLDATAA